MTHRRLRITPAAWKLFALWGVAALVIVLAVSDLLPGPGRAPTPLARASRVDPRIPEIRTPDATSSDAVAQRQASRSAAKAKASKSAAQRAQQQHGQDLLNTLAPVSMHSEAAKAAVGGIDLATGDRVSWSSVDFGKGDTAYTASVVKLEIAQAFLLSLADAGTEPSERDQALLRDMISVSDNEAADVLFDRVGGKDGLTALGKRLGLHDTVIGNDGEWGLSTTSVADQLILLSNLKQPDGPLSAPAKQRILDLMGDVADDQAWGVSAGGTQPALKNGWLPLDDGTWAMNSVGIVTGANGHPLALVVLSNGWETEPEGEDVVEALAQDVAKALTT